MAKKNNSPYWGAQLQNSVFHDYTTQLIIPSCLVSNISGNVQRFCPCTAGSSLFQFIVAATSPCHVAATIAYCAATPVVSLKFSSPIQLFKIVFAMFWQNSCSWSMLHCVASLELSCPQIVVSINMTSVSMAIGLFWRLPNKRCGVFWVLDTEWVLGSLLLVDGNLLWTVLAWTWFSCAVARQLVACGHGVVGSLVLVDVGVGDVVRPWSWSFLQVLVEASDLASGGHRIAGQAQLHARFASKYVGQWVAVGSWRLVEFDSLRPGAEREAWGLEMRHWPRLLGWVCAGSGGPEFGHVPRTTVDWVVRLTIMTTPCDIGVDEVARPGAAVVCEFGMADPERVLRLHLLVDGGLSSYAGREENTWPGAAEGGCNGSARFGWIPRHDSWICFTLPQNHWIIFQKWKVLNIQWPNIKFQSSLD